MTDTNGNKAAAELKPRDLKSMGKYNFIDVAERSYHIQTEIIGSDMLKIRTTIMCGGMVVDVINQTLSSYDRDPELLKGYVDKQHELAITEVRKGTISGG